MSVGIEGAVIPGSYGYAGGYGFLAARGELVRSSSSGLTTAGRVPRHWPLRRPLRRVGRARAGSCSAAHCLSMAGAAELACCDDGVMAATGWHERRVVIGGRRVVVRAGPEVAGSVPLVQVHGFAVSGRYLLPTAAALAHRALALDRVILVGNSMGGPVCLEVAHSAPERVCGVVLASPAGGVHNQPLCRALVQPAREVPRENPLQPRRRAWSTARMSKDSHAPVSARTRKCVTAHIPKTSSTSFGVPSLLAPMG
jgi:pimeloyl-ACP methyl ester carboxylesterase